VNSILILFDINQKTKTPSMKLRKIQPGEFGSDKFGLTERNDEANIYFPHVNAC
jgi:hypothetical protein